MDPKKRIVSRLEDMHVYLGEPESILPKSKNVYLQNLTVRRACERTIGIAIESVFDIASMIVSRERLGFPDSEESLIRLLEQKRILSSTVTGKIENMKKFRNVLIHKYGDVDNTLVYQFLTEDLNDFDLFEKEIKRYLKSRGKK